MKERIFLCVVFMVAALCCIGLGVYVTFFHTKGYVETTGTITRIDVKVRPGTQKHGSKNSSSAYVEYYVDGVRYESISDIYESSYYVGKEIPVFYDPKDPSKMRGNGTKLGYFFIGIGVIAIPFSLLSLKAKPTPKRRYDMNFPFLK